MKTFSERIKASWRWDGIWAIAAEADTQIAALTAERDALRADMDWLEKRKYRESRDGGYSAFFSINVPAMAMGPWQRDHGGEFDCKTLREAIDNERSKA